MNIKTLHENLLEKDINYFTKLYKSDSCTHTCTLYNVHITVT